jgi:hypothetical protein
MRRTRNGSSNLPPSHPSMDALTKSLLQRDFSLDGICLGRDFSMEMINRRLRSRECSFENGGLSLNHREMSMSIEFVRPRRSNLSMEMQFPMPRNPAGLHQGAFGDGLAVGAVDVGSSDLRTSLSALFTNVDGAWTVDSGVYQSTTPQYGVAGHISRSFRGRSKDDLMLDLRGGQASDRDRFVRCPNSGTLEDVREPKHPF